MVVLPSSFPRQGCADSAPLRWWGWVACAVCSRGAVATLLECTESSLRQWRHGGGGCMFAAACLRLCERRGVEPGESLHRHSCQVVVVAAPLGCRSSRWGQHYRAPRPEAWSLEVKTRSSLLDGGASSLGASLMETRLGLWQCGRWPRWPVCSGNGGAQGQCVGGKVQRGHGCWRA